MCGKIHEDCQNTDYSGFSKKKHGFLKTGLVEFGKNLRKALNYAL